MFITWKGMLILVALGASPTDQPIKTTGWGQIYDPTNYHTIYPASADAAAHAACDADIRTKANELNVVYAQAEITNYLPVGQMGRWKGVCYQ
jgi:hypothetical protein